MNDGDAAIQATIEENPQAVSDWLAGKPGSWGFLAGKAVIAYRNRLGRPLAYGERRIVWELLWQRLQQISTQQSAISRQESPDCFFI